MNDKFYSSLENSISQSRLSTYRNSNSNDRQVVIIDYILNAKISENFYFLLQNLEVSLRNAIYESFKLNYQNKDFFFLHETDSRERYRERKEKHSRECWKMICAAKYNVQRCNTTINDGKIIAELNFGFWIKLLLSTDAKYTNMWRKIFNDVFPNYEIVLSIDNDRIIVGKIIDKIRDLRNRIFHYEPIFNKNLEQMHKDIIEVIGWINKDMQQLSLIFDEYETIQQKREYISNKLL
ncbi:Abi family protein [Aliarcobacter butzleri]|uniref:Abi family protein n=1 Tax=Aliarcobacter butzleri TaxID=28197 RepID=UPI0021B40CAE|nr:Abi family protein [Aliarcobacter butzleri]MCT7550700.1 Abi family protein [Aliarcobacter butzleri]MCT7559299.1 Abi family protein [Aliarcobacter butzleri]